MSNPIESRPEQIVPTLSVRGRFEEYRFMNLIGLLTGGCGALSITEGAFGNTSTEFPDLILRGAFIVLGVAALGGGGYVARYNFRLPRNNPDFSQPQALAKFVQPTDQHS
jgi:hypothetical protein